MKLGVMNDKGAATRSTIEVSEEIFAAKFNDSLVHQLVIAYQAGARSGTRAQKNRSAVRGGGAKPWKQKGTGRARAGTIRSPLWRGGGKVFPATNTDFSQKLNKKMRRAGLRSILSELLRQERLLAVEDFKMEAPKTKDLAERLKQLGVNDVLIVTDGEDRNLSLSARNMRAVDVCNAANIDPVALIGHEKVIMTTDALKRCGEMLA
jgi:large subunit ribosomal protein L4